MASCLIVGGAGFIGTKLANYFLESQKFEHVYIADIQTGPIPNSPYVTNLNIDVRQAFPESMLLIKPDWIFNLAAVHREPGHDAYEYFETNLLGARNVCSHAESVNCKNIFFTSSISVYGPTSGPTTERSQICPTTPYGSSKLAAELIHESWFEVGKGERRLIVVRPGVVYGPGDPGNILRMIKAIRKGYFIFPGSPKIYKSYAYIYGLLESIEFMMNSHVDSVAYNYVGTPTETLGDIVNHTKEFFGKNSPVICLPNVVLLPCAHLIQLILGRKSPIHPARVKKAGLSTHIVPQVLLNMGFRFNYSFLESLKHWNRLSKEDFN